MEASRFLVVFSNVLLFLSTISTANRVNLMNQLLSHSGWLYIRSGDCNMHIIDSQERYDTKVLLEKCPQSQIVTDENVETKIRQAHLFLSCRYVNLVKSFIDYQRGIGFLCEKMTDSYESSECLIYLIDVIKKNDTIVLHMLASLSWFDQLLPKDPFQKDVSEILGQFKDYYDNKTIDTNVLNMYGTDEMILSTVNDEYTNIEEYMSDMVRRLNIFFNCNCWPVPWPESEKGISAAMVDVQKILVSRPTMMNTAINIASRAKNVIEAFLETEYENFGLTFDRSSKIARLIDSDQMRRVDQMNRLLLNNGWKRMGPYGDMISILRQIEDSDYTNVDRLLKKIHNSDKIVNNDNVNTKIELAQQFLSCKYAKILKEFCDFFTTILSEFPSELTEYTFNELLNTVISAYSLVLRFHGALSYFYQMAPNIEYNITMSLILNKFKGFCERIQIMKYAVDDFFFAEEYVTSILKNVKTFFRQSCHPYGNHMEPINKSLEQGYHVKRIIKIFYSAIYEYKNTAFKDFGFAYDSNLNTVGLI